jgi:DNA-binding NarL/FixJ family response regulator
MDNNTKFNTYIQALSQYVAREGNSKVPAIHVEKFEEKDVSLGAWVGYIRQRHRKNQLSQERIEKINSVVNWQWGPFQPGPATDLQRNQEILSMRSAGKSLREIADQFDLSRQRVHQILKKSENQAAS